MQTWPVGERYLNREQKHTMRTHAHTHTHTHKHTHTHTHWVILRHYAIIGREITRDRIFIYPLSLWGYCISLPINMKTAQSLMKMIAYDEDNIWWWQHSLQYIVSKLWHPFLPISEPEVSSYYMFFIIHAVIIIMFSLSDVVIILCCHYLHVFALPSILTANDDWVIAICVCQQMQNT